MKLHLYFQAPKNTPIQFDPTTNDTTYPETTVRSAASSKHSNSSYSDVLTDLDQTGPPKLTPY